MGDAALIGARFLQFSGVLTLFGASFFLVYSGDGHSTVYAAVHTRWARSLALLAAAIALAGTLLWSMAEGAQFGESARDAFNPDLLGTILFGTRFGLAAVVRLVLLAISIVASLCLMPSRRFWIAQATLGALATASFAWSGHGATGSGLAGRLHLGADLLHLIAAGIWLGALPLLARLARDAARSGSVAAASLALRALDDFSAIGYWVVLALAASGIVNTWFLVGWQHLGAWSGSAYGRLLALKLAIFGAMLVLGALHRFQSAPSLRLALRDADRHAVPLSALKKTLTAEAAFGLLVLLAVSALGMLSY